MSDDLLIRPVGKDYTLFRIQDGKIIVHRYGIEKAGFEVVAAQHPITLTPLPIT